MSDLMYVQIPNDFDWEFYLNYNTDLQLIGLQNEEDAMWHYHFYGKKENRIYKKIPTFYEKITFIHIPKCGGTSIVNFLKNTDVERKTIDFKIEVSGHTTNHLTYQELKKFDLLSENIFTIIRSNIDRTISEFFYIKKYRPDLNSLFNTFDEFLNVFLDKKNVELFDYHNLSNKEFLMDENGFIDPKIKMFNYFDTESIEKYLGVTGLNNYHELKTEKSNLNLSEKQIEKIINFFGEDLI